MSLKSSIFFDISVETQTLTYTLNNNQVDELVFSGNQVTLSTIPSFNLIKSDLILYNSFLITFVNGIISNFPNVQVAKGASLPLSSFQIQLSNPGVEHIIFNQTSLGNTIYNTNYVPSSQSSSFSSRSVISITMQEFFVMCELHNLFANQVNLN